MALLRADSPLQFIKGVGPRKAECFASLGLATVGDLLEYFPFRHELEFGRTDIADLTGGMQVSVRGEVQRTGGRPPGFYADIYDGTADCRLRWFQRGPGVPRLSRGVIVIASGRVQEHDDHWEIVQPSIKVFEPDTLIASLPEAGMRQVGVYRANAQISSRAIQRTVETILAQARLPVEEVMPQHLARRYGLLRRADAIRAMHAPKDEQHLAAARRRLAYEEFLYLELAMALRRYRQVSLQTGIPLRVSDEIDRRIRARFPFKLTGGQDRAVAEIVRDLQSGRPMTRLLQGDVGSGKTVVALYACLAAIANRSQAAIMAPTEILAAQHFANVQAYLRDSRVRCALLRGRIAKKRRAQTLAQVEAGEIDLLVGTQALLEKDVAFKNLAMVIVDEQHKFGVLQRAHIRTKGPLPHYLVMTATPIPRTLAMTVFGDLDVSIIDEMPPGRGATLTRVVRAAQWLTVMRYVRKRLEAGEQAYVVCPLIGEDASASRASAEIRHTAKAARPGPPLVSAKAAHEKLVGGPWKGLEVGLLHGALKSAEKQAVIDAFSQGRLHAIVATTVVEVGVDVPNATVMIVENADRFGLSQLHQLRGRIGRGSKDALCVLISRSRGPKAAERLDAMLRTNDGFKIAEADLRQRGPGELFGTRQHGLPQLRVGDMLVDFELLELARRDAFEIVARDPKLARPEHHAMLPALRRMFGGKLALVDAG